MDNKKILIVDDDPDVRQGMHLRLKANHYDTFFAADAFSGVAEARKHEPDLIILDLGLPAGDGFIVMERLKQIPSLAVIPDHRRLRLATVSANQKRALSRQERRPFFRNPWIMPNSWRSSGKPWENPRDRRNLLCMTRDRYDGTHAGARPNLLPICLTNCGMRLPASINSETSWSMGWQVNCPANNASIVGIMLENASKIRSVLDSALDGNAGPPKELANKIERVSKLET